MNNKVIIGIVVVIIVLLGIFMINRNKSNQTEVASNNSSANSASQTSVESGSLKSLISAGQTRKCTFKSNESGVDSSGTVYASGGKMRGDFGATVNGKEMMTHMVYDGTMSYVWTEGTTTGFKMALDTNAQASSQNNSVDPNKNYEFNCEKWSADNSKFELPSNVQFNELPTMPAGAGAGASGTMDTKAIQQAACANLPEPSKSQCLAAIK